MRILYRCARLSRKLLLVLGGGALFVGIAPSASSQSVFFDDFERPDSTDPGPGWEEMVGDWEIFQNQLRSSQTDLTLEKIAAYSAVALEAPFVVEAELGWPLRNQWNGIVWHIRDGATFYVLRSRADSGAVQVIRRVDGGNARIIVNAPDGTVTIPPGGMARMRVMGDARGNFRWSISEGDNLLTDGAFSDTGLTGGNAGIYGGREGIVVDSFQVGLFPLHAGLSDVGLARAVEVFFDAIPGRYFQLESSVDLREWTPETDVVIGEGGEVSSIFSIRGEPRRFFRAVFPEGPIAPSPETRLIVPPIREDRPRLMFTPFSLARMKVRVEGGEEPWASAAQVLLRDAEPVISTQPRPYTGRHSYEFYQNAVRDGERARLLAYAWLVSEEDRYAESALDYLVSWATAEPTPASDFDPELRFTATGMEVARVSIAFLEAYDLLRDHPALSGVGREAIESWFRVLVEPIKTGKQRWEDADYFNRQDFQNHLTAHTMGLAAIGFTLGDRELVQFALDHPDNDRDFKTLIAGSILMEGQEAHHREPAYANPPLDGEIYDRYRHFTAGGKGIQYVHLALSQLLYTAEIAWNNGIDFYGYTAPGGENLKLPLRLYADLFKTEDLAEVGGFFAAEGYPARAEQEQLTLTVRQDFPLIFEVGNLRYLGTPEIEALLRSRNRVAVPRHQHSSFFYPVLTHGEGL